MRVAAIDCGTNSIRLLIADIEGESFREVLRTMEIVRLGQGVDETGQFHPDAITRTLAAVDKFAAEIASRVALVAQKRVFSTPRFAISPANLSTAANVRVIASGWNCPVSSTP